MRTPKVLLLSLVLGVLTGCGTTVTASPAPSQSPSAAGKPSSAPARKPAPLPKRTKATKNHPKPASTSAAATPRRPKKKHTGPANSLLRTGRAGVALTFDDGPDPVQTPRLLNLLKKQHVKATFCVVGTNAAKYPGLIRRIAAEGHTLCNHTWRHSLTLGKQKPAVIKADLQRTNKAIRRAVPGAKIKYMRAPGGNFTPAFVKVATSLKMKSIYWQVDPRDWEHPKGETGPAHRAKVVRTIKRHVGKGAIVLSHDYRQPETIAAYTKLLPWLKKRYRLIALP